uniref:RNA helicase n=1 Tax=Hirondellea gigas TaxID=1518452 RepID=A0A6A7FSI6_9CRUS
MGFKSKSRGSGCNRYLTVYKKEGSSILSKEAVLSLCPVAVSVITGLVQRWPVTTRERQDLLPLTDRDRLLSTDLRELGLLRSLGRLTPGPPQVPPMPSYSDVSEEARSLPIWEHQHQILEAVARNQVIMVCGETGSGKTTQVPQMLLNQATSQSRPVRILCTQPRRISAVTIADRVAHERGEKLGFTVGYQIRLESKLCPKTLLTFCTNGVLLRTLMAGESALATITHVLIDEVHERDRFTDFLLTVLKDCLPKFQHLKLVLMSAAMDVALYSRYFGSCPIIDVPGRCYPVTEHFLEDVLKLTEYETKEMTQAYKHLSRVENNPNSSDDWTKRLEGIVTSSAVADAISAASTAAAAKATLGAAAVKKDPMSPPAPAAAGAAVGQETGDEDVVIEDAEESECNREMDEVLEGAYFTGSNEAFAQMLYLIMSEDISPDYQHSQSLASPLMVSAGRGRVAVLEQLLSLGATLTLRSSDNRTALAWAATTGQQEAIDLLKCYGASEGVTLEDDPSSSATSMPKTGIAAAKGAAAASAGSNQAQNSGRGSSMSPVDNKQTPAATEALTEQDMKRLQAYLMTATSDQMADVDLICKLCFKLHSTKGPGAILIFLPGYDSIIQARDEIQAQEDSYIRAGGRISIYCLHSSMQTADQKRVFKSSPHGVRKIILATNIAETSVTINDVVYVINSGKIKEVSFDNLSGASCLKEVWASQASALQRKGRAGRCQPGVVYHLFSRTRCQYLPPYQTPEILRVPLQELCLHTKLLAPANVPIADFLTRVPEPPSLLAVRSAVQLLKCMEAIDGWEEVTALGHHLLELPLAPHLGKMVLVATILKCLDPVLTVVACLAHKDPFTLPRGANERCACNDVKRKLAAGSCSDHMVLIRVFQQWQKAHAEGWERKWCAKNYVSSATMEMIHGIRGQILAQLRGMGFVKPRGPHGDIRDCNSNSNNWGMVKAAIVAGVYPNLIRTDREQHTLRTHKKSEVRLHPSCSLYDLTPADSAANNLPSMSRLTKKSLVKALPTDWLVYGEMILTGAVASARTVTVVSPITVLLMAGPTRLPLQAISTAVTDNGSDSESEDQPLNKYGRLRLDEWVQFVGAPDMLQLALQLRHKLHAIILRRLKAPGKSASQGDDDVIKVVATALSNEDARLGISTPMSVGQRPMYMMPNESPPHSSRTPSHRSSPAPSTASHQATTPINTSRSSNNNGNTKTILTNTSKNNSNNTNASKNHASYASPSIGGKEVGPKSVVEAKTGKNAGGNQKLLAGASLKLAADYGNNGKGAAHGRRDPVVEQIANSLKNLASGGARNTNTGKEPRPGGGAAAADGSNTASASKGPYRYYMVRASGYRQLESAMQSGSWSFTDASLENKVLQAAQNESVMLVFGHAVSTQLHGCARFSTKKVVPATAAGATKDDKPHYQVEWVAKTGLPLQVTRNLHNLSNDGLQVHATKSGQEIDSATGDKLLELWQKHEKPQLQQQQQQPSSRHDNNSNNPHHHNQQQQHQQHYRHQHQPYHHNHFQQGDHGGDGQGHHGVGYGFPLVEGLSDVQQGQGYGGQRYHRGGGGGGGYGGGYRAGYRRGGYRR